MAIDKVLRPSDEMNLFRQPESSHVERMFRMHHIPSECLRGHLCTLDFRGPAILSIGELDFGGYIARHMPVIQDQAIYSKRNAPITLSGGEASEGFAEAVRSSSVEDAADVNLISHTEYAVVE